MQTINNFSFTIGYTGKSKPIANMQMELFYDKQQGWEIYHLVWKNGMIYRQRYYYWKYWYQIQR